MQSAMNITDKKSNIFINKGNYIGYWVLVVPFANHHQNKINNMKKSKCKQLMNFVGFLLPLNVCRKQPTHGRVYTHEIYETQRLSEADNAIANSVCFNRTYLCLFQSKSM